MPRPATGSIRPRKLASGETAFDARFSLPKGPYPDPLRRRIELCLGTTPDWSPQRAEVELQRILAQVAVGAWVDPKTMVVVPEPEPGIDDPSFHAVASEWWAKERGRRNLSERTIHDYYEWRLRTHLLPAFADWPVSTIDARAIDKFVASKLKTDRNPEGLSASSVNKLLQTLGRILELARDYDYGGLRDKANAAKGENRRAREEDTARAERTATWLRYDQLTCLLDAAAELDDGLTLQKGGRHYRIGRRAMMLILFTGGLRVSELCELCWGDVNLDLGLIEIGKSKTGRGIREVPLPSITIQALRDWQAFAGSTNNGAWVFPSDNGNQRTRHSVRQRVLAPVVTRAQALAVERDIKWPEKALSTHAGRRTTVTYLVACGLDIGTIQDIIGHEDARVTLSIYRQRDGRAVDPRVPALMHGPHPWLQHLKSKSRSSARSKRRR